MPNSSQPLVSCVMPTTARRRLFVPRAIRYFQRQDYPNKELLVVDDGAESLADLVPEDPQVRYIRLEGARTLGAKRNLCVEAARGDLIMHWDDDDWASAERIRLQIESLLRADAEVCGLRQMIFYELTSGNAWLYEYPAGQRAWLAGGSLLYTREFWRRSPFPDVQVASDTRFVWSQQMDRAVAVPKYDFYVAMIHAENTSAKNHQGAYWSPWTGNLRTVMGADYEFYQPLLMNTEKHELLKPAENRHSETAHAASGRTPAFSSQRTSAIEPAVFEETHEAKPLARTPSREVVRVNGYASRTLAYGKQPQVSCILATGNRPAFTRQAIRCFLRQTFDDAELIVVDDGQPSVAELCEGLFRVRHIRLAEPTTLGRKLNIGIENSRAAIIQKLDDDDFYRESFLARSVSAIQAAADEQAIVSWDCFTVFIVGQSEVRYSGHGWTTGGTLCFRRSLWERQPFRDEPNRVDAWFIEDHRARLLKICDPEQYMLVRHGRNTWERLSNGMPVDDYFRFLPRHRRTLDELVEPIDRAFYHSLAHGGGK